MSNEKIRSLINDYARSDGLKLSKLREAIQDELQNIRQVSINEASEGHN